ncbi:extracellular solute-binding protein [Cohnella sp. CFH 77786]|uniref:extracellular solute-binding protein n=1 Tax=Cohnella sp. CFH 77786 TaxID=2662265 RepID=UPI001C60F333|nr:extracellular solute-binding protein [Cohnella sp. CFH 77786]MBW5445236.1 extracellular solute-binding protein [Cohnella sp. CFH 77786]
MRWYAFLLAVVICAGCDGSSPGGATATDHNPDAFFDEALGKFDPPVVLETVGAVTPNIVFADGETLENNVHTRWAEERLGIHIRYKWTIQDTNGAYGNKLRIELAKGTLPDIVTTRESTVIQELIDSGQFAEVGGLFDRYASPTWKAAMREDPAAWDALTRDGRKYAIPILDYDYNSDPVLWIRKDWLDKLHLGVPRTMEELERVMQAFTERDPDGDGLKDTFGLTVSFAHGANTWMADSSWIFGAYGAVPKQWNRSANGMLAYGSVQPGMKEALRLLKSWIAKSYVPAESQWYDETQAAQLFVTGKAGIVAGPYWMSGWPLAELKKTDAGARYDAIPIPSGPSHIALRRGTQPVNGAILINKKMKHPEIFFKYQNYLFDYYAASKGEFQYGLAEGYDWTVKDGKPTDDPADLPLGGIRVASYTLTFDGARIPSQVVKAMPKDVEQVLLSQRDASRKDQFTGPPTPTMKKNWELLQKLEQKSFEAILFGDGSADAFDAFANRWFEFGGARITREVNEWYAASKSSVSESP